MSTPYEVPLTPEPQTFSINLAGADYSLRLLWCKPSASWTLDMFDVNGVAVLEGIPIVTGVDMLGQYAHLGIGGKLIAQTDHDPSAVPTLTNLGIAGRLYFVVG